jgi:outer membrane protein assembly factor BamB
MKAGTRILAIGAAAAVVFTGGELWAGEGLYEFAAVPSSDSNSFYRLNTATGELNWCYYVKGEAGDAGKTVCDPAGSNAGPQRPGVYGLLPTNLKTDAGIFRVDKLSGKVWQCFPDSGKTVCAAPAP